MRMQIPRKLRTEDFSSDNQEDVGKIADVYNPAIDEINQILSGRVEFENLNRQLAYVDILINSSGVLVNPPTVKLQVSGKVVGINTINAVNLNNPGTFVTGLPFVNFTTNGNLLTILNVTSLQNSSNYRLTLEIIGQT